MSNEKKLHVICHDVPYPPDFGGVVDLFYKIKALHAEGVKIKLHCFLNKRPAQEELKNYCDEVYYYKRQTGLFGFSLREPYIVHTRACKELLNNLLKDADPVLMEGEHCSAFAPELLAQKRKVFLRLHNTESAYYYHLYRSESNPIKKIYFFYESKLLKQYEKNLPPDLPVMAVSEKDAGIFHNGLGKKDVKYLPVFIPWSSVTGAEGIGSFCLYHGNLSIPENEKAATWLLSNVFSKIRIPIVIAGKNPSTRLEKLVHRYRHTCLAVNPSEQELNDLIGRAHINVLPSFNNTGIKLKLINALYNGRHCVVNEAAVAGSGLEAACHTGTEANAIASIISQLYHQPFAEEEIMLRKNLLPSIFNNEANAKKLIQWIW